MGDRDGLRLEGVGSLSLSHALFLELLRPWSPVVDHSIQESNAPAFRGENQFSGLSREDGTFLATDAYRHHVAHGCNGDCHGLGSDSSSSVAPESFMQASLSVVLATYNEVAAIWASRWPIAGVIVVDDDSPDGTAQVVPRLSRQDPRARLLLRYGVPPSDDIQRSVTSA